MARRLRLCQIVQLLRKIVHAVKWLFETDGANCIDSNAAGLVRCGAAVPIQPTLPVAQSGRNAVASGTTHSAASLGVSARTSATKSDSVTSISCPTAETTGIREA